MAGRTFFFHTLNINIGSRCGNSMLVGKLIRVINGGEYSSTNAVVGGGDGGERFEVSPGLWFAV